MISKDHIINSFSKDELNKVIKIFDKYQLAYQRDIPVIVEEFLTPNIWSYFQKFGGDKYFKVDSFGAFNEAERRILSFNNIYNNPMPIEILEISNKSSFSKIEHKDYLGAIMSLGIEREKIGDLVVDDERAIVPVIKGLSSYIINNLDKVSNSKINIKIINDIKSIRLPELNEEIVNLSALRIDALVAKLAKVSRSQANEIIQSGRVQVDYSKVTDKGYEIKEESRVTIRGSGKFIVGEITGETKSGKLKVKIKKYT